MSKGISKPALPTLTERDLREQIRDLCKLFGWQFWFCWTSLHSPRGMTDLILCRPPRLIFAELKSDTGKLTASQQEWADLLRACLGVEYYCWKPSDFQEIVSKLR